MATIKEVAKLAGVSVGTVSNVINNIPVKPKTKAAVEHAIKVLNYEPNIYARGLKVNRTQTVAVILPTVWDPFYGEVAYYLEKALRAYGQKMILCNSENNYLTELEFITLSKQNQVDGIIAITYSDIEPFVSSKLPFVAIDRLFSSNVTCITSDNFEGGQLAAKQLIASGAKTLGFIGRGSKKENTTQYRKTGFKSYCEKHQIPFHMCDSSKTDAEFEIELEQFILDNIVHTQKIDGLFTITDRYAALALTLLQKYQVRVPEDVQVIGYDGSRSSIKDVFTISTIKQPVKLMAHESVKALNQVIHQEEVPHEIVLPVEFIQGQTTKKQIN